MFLKAIPSVDCRSQVIHEAVVCGIGSVAFAIGVARIKYVLLVLVPSFIAQLSKEAMEYIKKQHLSILFKIDLTTGFDNTLANFPSSRELARINWGYAVSHEMVMSPFATASDQELEYWQSSH
jgi:hypothetical protein